MTPITTRRVLGGGPDPHRPGVYLITLDGNQVVETDDTAILDAAKGAKRDGHSIDVELEAAANGANPRVLQLSIVQKAIATRPAGGAGPTSMARGGTPEIPTHLISQPQELAEQMRVMSQHYNVLSPAIAVSNMAPGYGANLAVVRIDPTVTMDQYGNGSGPDCYYSKSLMKDPEKRALNKQGLQKIAQAAGIQWMPSECRRLDDGKTQHLWRWQYFGYVRTHDGQLQPVQGSRELDLRDGAAEAAAMTANQLPKARAMGNQICETKAMQRAIRNLGIRQVYTAKELDKPFLIVRFSFTPDMNDPEIKKLVTERAMSGIGQLYPSPAPPILPALPAAADDIDESMPTAAADDKKAAATAATPAASEPAATAAVPSDLRHIADVKIAGQGKTQKGAPWTRYEIAATTGEHWSTFSESHYKTALEAKEKGWPVRVVDDENERFPDQRDLKSLTLVDPRQGTLPMGDEGKF